MLNLFKNNETKILILSDSHGRFNNIYKMAKAEKPDFIIFAGDNVKDILELSYAYEKPEYHFVKGNCDISENCGNWNKIINIENNDFLLTHGHRYSIKDTYNIILKEAERVNSKIIIFGHTHIPFYEIIDGYTLFNPGAAKDGQYGLIRIVNNELFFENKVLKKESFGFF